MMISLFLPAFFLTCTALSAPPACSAHGDFGQPAFMANGDIIIGGIFPLHYRVELPTADYTNKPLAAQCQG